MSIPYNTDPTSLFASLGEQRGTTTLVAMLSKIATSRVKIGPAEQAEFLIQSIEILQDICELKNLGVRKIEEEFKLRFCRFTGGKIVNLSVVPPLERESRIIPLFTGEPLNWNPLCYESFETKDQTRNFSEKFLYIDTLGNIIECRKNSAVKGNVIEYPHEVQFRVVDKNGLVSLLDHHHMIFDHCLRQLLTLCDIAIQRANQRLAMTQKANLALTLILEETRKRDLLNLIYRRIETSMPSSTERRKWFAQIATLAGDTFEERLATLSVLYGTLGVKSVINISGLDAIESRFILNDPSIFSKTEGA